MPNFNPKHNAPNLRKYVKKVMFNGKRALLMDKNDWEEAIKGKSGVFEIDERITPMSNVSQDNLIVGCLVE